MARNWLRLVVLGLALGLAACSQTLREETSPIINPQFGTVEPDVVSGLVISKRLGAVFVAGDHDPNSSIDRSHFLRRYNRDGSLRWQRIVGNTFDGNTQDVALTHDDGVIITISSEYISNILKYSASGRFLWSADPYPSGSDCAGGGYAFAKQVETAADGSIYVQVHATSCADPEYLIKYNRQGHQLWDVNLMHDPDDFKIAPDGSSYTVRTVRDAKYDPKNLILSKYDPEGKLVWERTLLAGHYEAGGLALTSDGLYVAGTKYFGTGGSETDTFIVKASLNGTVRWLRTFGTPQKDGAHALTLDPRGNVYITGYTSGSLSEANKGNTDIFIRKYTPTARVVWTRQIGSSGSESGRSIAAMSPTELYLAGSTSGNLGAGNRGGNDAYLMRTNGGGFKVWVR